MKSERNRQKRVVRDFLNTKQQIADHPDQLTAIIAARKEDERRAASPEPRSAGGQKVVQPIRTPFAQAVKAKAATAGDRAKQGQTRREARQIAKQLFAPQPDAPEPTRTLPAEGSSIVRQLFGRSSSI